MRKRYFLIIISLLISLFIYLFYRTEKTVINDIMINLIPGDGYNNLRESITHILPLNEILVYSLPEGLWVFCITLTSQFFYLPLFYQRIYGVYIPLVYAVGLEICQLFSFTNGRFDFLDICASIIFWFLANYFFSFKDEKQNILRPLSIKSMMCFASYGIVYLSHVLE